MKNSNKLPFRCKRLKELRRSINKTKKEMAELMEVTEKTYSSWEDGSYKKDKITLSYPEPSLNSLIKLSKIFNCSIDYLIGQSDCKDVENHYISDKTGLSEPVINYLHALTTMEHGSVHLAIVNRLLGDRAFLPVLTGLINSYYSQYDQYENTNKQYMDAYNEYKNIIQNDVFKAIELDEQDDIINQRKVDALKNKKNEAELSKDAAQFKVQKNFNNILESTIKYFYDKNTKVPDAN
jgi:transcriptional regulator with XRE-family HTH domain